MLPGESMPDYSTMPPRKLRITIILLFGIFVLAVIFLVRPFEAPTENDSDNVAIAWNRTMSRLGMESVYPPQEDVFVGDV